MLKITPSAPGALRRVALAAIVSIACLGSNASAELIEKDLATAGDKLLVKDTVTGKEFVKPLHFVNNTISQVQALIASGGSYTGFHIATLAEVNTMLTDASMPPVPVPTATATFSQVTITLQQLQAFHQPFGVLDWGYGPQNYAFVSDIDPNDATRRLTTICSHDTYYGMDPRMALASYPNDYGGDFLGWWLVRDGSLSPAPEAPVLAWQDVWTSSKAYIAGDVVTYRGSSFVATTSNTNVEPTSDSSTPWSVLAKKGDKGDKGDTGAQGIQGPAGPQGLAGPKGDTGATGATGPQGVAGPQGAAGPKGDKGDTGAAGPAGAQGVAGPIGATGPQGPAGPQGPVGAKGDTGLKGDTGAVGPAGPQGPAGAIGATGPQGPAGPQGPVGPQGLKGDTGAVGATGPQGEIGPRGEVGAVGPVGPQGEVGAKGDTGATGAVGPVGPQGPVGATGSVGPMGPQGPVGPVGPQGIEGAQGPAGVAGAVGPMGPMGPQGPAAPIGIYPLLKVTSNTTLAITDTVVVVDTPAKGTVNVTLPTATGNAGRYFVVKHRTGKAAAAVVATPGETIEGAATVTLAAGEVTKLISDGGGWIAVGP